MKERTQNWEDEIETEMTDEEIWNEIMSTRRNETEFDG